MISLLFFGFIFTFALFSVSFSLYKKLHGKRADDQNDLPTPELHLAGLCSYPDPEFVAGSESSDQVIKKKKKRAKKKKEKRLETVIEEESSLENEDKKGTKPDPSQVKPELICLYPFTSSGSATQRKIKQQYDELMKCHESKGLTLAQVAQFVNCLVEARTELQHKSEVFRRKFSITKALLFKAERSSFDRLRQQIYKLEFEQKRLEEDAFVYNWLQQQLKLSPAYKKMLEISASLESNATKTDSSMAEGEQEDADLPDISFEDFLAQEKKDSFWQNLGKSKAAS